MASPPHAREQINTVCPRIARAELAAKLTLEAPHAEESIAVKMETLPMFHDTA
jgi:hypothetical protein